MECNKIGLGGFTARIKCARLFAAGLDNQLSWRIRHPQASKPKGRQKQTSCVKPSTLLLGQSTRTVDWGHGSGAKENAPISGLTFWARVLRLPDPPFPNQKEMATMVYTFIVAHSSQKLAQLKKLRTVSTFAHTEEQARKNFPGMPLVLQARTHAHRAQGGAA